MESEQDGAEAIRQLDGLKSQVVLSRSMSPRAVREKKTMSAYADGTPSLLDDAILILFIALLCKALPTLLWMF